MPYRPMMSAAILVVGFGTFLVAGAATAANQKVTLCHVPPGNPSNAHEIVVSESALRGHFRNHPGDQGGPCTTGCQNAGDCNDAKPCTIDVCNADGTCDNTQPADCDDGNVCTVNACDPQTGCVNPPEPSVQERGPLQ